MNCTWYTTESWAEPISEVKLTWLLTWECLEMRLRVDQGTKCKKTAWQLQQEIIVTLSTLSPLRSCLTIWLIKDSTKMY